MCCINTHTHTHRADRCSQILLIRTAKQQGMLRTHKHRPVSKQRGMASVSLPLFVLCVTYCRQKGNCRANQCVYVRVCKPFTALQCYLLSGYHFYIQAIINRVREKEIEALNNGLQLTGRWVKHYEWTEIIRERSFLFLKVFFCHLV